MKNAHASTFFLRRLAVAALLVVIGNLAPAVQAQDAPPKQANPHAPPPPDPALLENPVEGPRPPAPAEPPAASPTTAAAPRPAPTTRYDLAWAFMRFERALAAAKPEGDDLRRANRAFDDATFAFFRGAASRAVSELDAETMRLSARDTHPAANVVPWLRVRISPPAWTYYSSPAPSIVLRGADGAKPLEGDAPKLSVSIEPETRTATLTTATKARGALLAIPDVRAALSNAGVSITLADMTKSLPPGRYTVNLIGEGGFVWPVGAWTVVSASRADVRSALEAKLAAAEKAHAGNAALLDAFASFRLRLAMLKDAPSESKTTEFLIDPNTLESELAMEAASLAAGNDPYKARPGLVYGAFRSGTEDAPVSVPVWTHAPADVLTQRVRPALVIALHGAGADESMFMFGYGEGVIRSLADEMGFIVAAPLAYAFTTNPKVLDDLLTSMKARYDIDESRVYLVGHSMGAIAASGLAQARNDKIAGVAAIAGLRPFSPGQASAPVLAYPAEFDRIIPAERVRAAAEAAQKEGLPVELREAKGQGHTLVVGAVLRECIEWLLARPSR